jgi:hypothetical protein
MEREQTKLLSDISIVTSLTDIPMVTDYQNQKMIKLRTQMQMNSMLQDAVSNVMKSFGSALSAAARN